MPSSKNTPNFIRSSKGGCHLCFFVFLLVLFLFSANFAFALEITYPSVPGVDKTPKECLELGSEEKLGCYIKYFYSLFLMAAGVIALGAIVFGGIKYLISGGNVTRIKDARDQISAGVLGLVILFSSYLILVTINPQLAIFHLTLPSLPPTECGNDKCEVGETPETCPEDCGLPPWQQIGLTSVYEELPAETSIERILDKVRLYYILGLACRFKENARTLTELSDDLVDLARDIYYTDTGKPGCDCWRTYPVDRDGNRVTGCRYGQPCPIVGCGGDPCEPVREAMNNKIAEIEEVLAGDDASVEWLCRVREGPGGYCASSFYTQDLWYRYYEPCYNRIKGNLMQAYNELLYELFKLQKLELLMDGCNMQRLAVQPLSYQEYGLQEETTIEGMEGYEIEREQLPEWRGTSIAGDAGGTFYCPKTEQWTELLRMADSLAMQEKAEMGLTYASPIPRIGPPPSPGDTCDPQDFTDHYLPKLAGYESFIAEANFAEARTGVRAPLLLALLGYESGFQQCVGGGRACTTYHEDCRGWDERNCQIITEIWNELGGENYDVFDNCGWESVEDVQVSMSGEYTAAGETIFHCGGAMGPPQVIPTTWLGYKDRVAAITGFEPASPWEYTDAFVFAGLHLGDSGASGGTCLQEMNAVWSYVGGHSQHAVCIVELADYLAQYIAPGQGWRTCP